MSINNDLDLCHYLIWVNASDAYQPSIGDKACIFTPVLLNITLPETHLLKNGKW
jgi:hypothetical protein